MKKGLVCLAALLASTSLANAQIVYGAGGTGGGGGSGTVTNIATGAGLTGGPITTTGTIAATEVINAQTGTTYTIQASDAAELVTFTNASPIAVTLPQATGSFAAGFGTTIQNKGAGLVTITPTTSTINGNTTLTIAANTGCDVVSDGTNYQVAACTAIVPAGSGTVNSGTAFNLALYPSTGTTVSDGGGTTAASVGGLNVVSATAGTATNGMFLCTTNQPCFYVAGTARLTLAASTATFTGQSIVSGSTGGFQINTGAASSTFPIYAPNKSATTTGWGAQAAGNISCVIVAVERCRITNEGYIPIQATAPTVGGTTTPTIATGSTDESGEVTAGTTATSVVITFNLTHTNAPFCVVTSQTQLVAFAYTLSNTAITITQTATTGNKIDYRCSFH